MKKKTEVKNQILIAHQKEGVEMAPKKYYYFFLRDLDWLVI